MTDPNLFLLPAPGQPGRFTAALHALIHHVPAVGEVMAAWLAESPAIEALFPETHGKMRFQKSVLHPHPDPADRPDFVLVCEGVEILCAQTLSEEHAEAQLERYLLRRGDEGRVSVMALITRDPTHVPAAVVADPYFLGPPETDEGSLGVPVEHHRWCGLHERLENHPDTRDHPLVRDFLAYMDLLGMHPWRIGRWEDLFTNAASAELMFAVWAEVKEALGDVATGFTRDSNGLGMIVKRPRPWMRKLYVIIEREASVSVTGVDLARPVLTAQAWVGRERPEGKALRTAEAGVIEGADGLIAHAPAVGLSEWDSFLNLTRVWHEPLDEVLVGDRDATVARLAGFVQQVLAHATALVSGTDDEATSGEKSTKEVGRYYGLS